MNPTPKRKSQTYLLFALFSLFISIASSAQIAFYDAQEIITKCIRNGKLENKEELVLILKNYYPEDAINSQTLKLNPFFAPYVQDELKSTGTTAQRNALFPSQISGLEVTKLANAIASLMIERSKQELTVAFFNRFKKFAEDNQEFAILFPKSTANLSNLLAHTYPQMLPALRSGFFDDIKQVTYRLDDVMELPKYKAWLKKFPEIRVAIRSLSLIQDIETDAANAADVISSFASFGEWKEQGSNTFKNMGSTIRFAAIFSKALRGNLASGRIWIEPAEAASAVQDPVFLDFFMGLLYRQVEEQNLEFNFTTGNAPVKLKDILKDQRGNIILFQTKLKEFSSIGDKVFDLHTNLNAKVTNNEKLSNEDLYDYISTSIEAIDYSFSVLKVFDENLVYDNYLSVVRKSNELYKNVFTSNYTQAVNDAVDILVQLNELAATAQEKEPLGNLVTFAEKLKPYALFMANIVDAKDEDAIKAALENVILPVGSSSIKKYTHSNLSVQSYLGAFLSTSNGSTTSGGTWTNKFGVTAPVGIAWTPGVLSWQKCGAISIFGSIADVGAIVDYKLRIEPDPTSSDPNAQVIEKEFKIEFGQIFSPGIFAVYGFGRNIPLALGFGAQYGPGLSKIETNNNTEINNPSLRWNLFLAVDLPFFTLINKSRNY